MEEQIMNMPAVALRGLTILPGMIAHFDISRERSFVLSRRLWSRIKDLSCHTKECGQ